MEAQTDLSFPTPPGVQPVNDCLTYGFPDPSRILWLLLPLNRGTVKVGEPVVIINKSHVTKPSYYHVI